MSGARRRQAHRPATYADLLKLPENVVGEIIDGVLHTFPRPAARHARAATRIGGRLDGFDGRGQGDNPGGWWILDEPELHLVEDVLVPDLAGWRHETMPRVPDVAYFEVRPDWVCEVLSPSTARVDRILKLAKYAAAGVGHAWLVDPMARTLEVFRLHDGHWLLIGQHAGEDVVRAEPFEAVELELSRWWLEDEPAAE